MTMEQLYGFEPDPRDIAEDAEHLHDCTPQCEELAEVWGHLRWADDGGAA